MQTKEKIDSSFSYMLGIVFIVVSMGVAYNYNELNNLKREIEGL